MIESRTLGDKISEARANVRLSQSRLAEMLFVSPQAVGKWERGESLPDFNTIEKMALIFGVDLNYFSSKFSLTPAIPSEESSLEVDYQLIKPKPKIDWDMSKGNWSGANFSGLTKLHEKFSFSNMQNCIFEGSDLGGIELKGNNIEDCDFSKANFTGSVFGKSYLNRNLFVDASLKNAHFHGTFITDCNFSGANLTDLNFDSGGMDRCKLNEASLSRVSFVDVYLANMEISGEVNDCKFENCSFKNFVFKNAIIKNTFFKAKSLKKIKLVNCKMDRLTYEFLKNGKADLSDVEIVM